MRRLETKMTNCKLIFASCALILAVGFSAPWVLIEPSTAAEIDQPNESVKGPLDGKSFTGALGPDGKPKDTNDRFVFENGTFVSKECELRCKYPARPYFVRKIGDKTEFVSETKCPYKDAKIVWRGTVEGDTIEGVSIWTIKRWYWTVEKTFEFSGKLEQATAPVASAQ